MKSKDKNQKIKEGQTKMGIGPAKVANDADTEIYQVLVQRYLLTEKKGLHLRPPNFQTNVSDLF